MVTHERYSAGSLLSSATELVMRRFDTEHEFLAALKDSWQEQRVPPAVLEALKTGVQESDRDVRGEAELATGALNLRLKGWVLRNEDLPVLESIGIVATA